MKLNKDGILKKMSTKIPKEFSHAFLSIFFIFIALIAIASIPDKTMASGCTGSSCYIPLVSIGSNITGCDTSTSPSSLSLATYITYIVKICIFAAGAIAVIEITYGGFKYLFSNSEPGKSGGRENIDNALIGLALALCSWLILNTINPQLVSLSLFTSDLGSAGAQQNSQSNPCGGTVQSVNNGNSQNSLFNNNGLNNNSQNPTTPPPLNTPPN